MEQEFTEVLERQSIREDEKIHVAEILRDREIGIENIIRNFHSVSRTLEIVFAQVLTNDYDTTEFFKNGSQQIVDLPSFATNQMLAGTIAWTNSYLNPIWFNRVLDGQWLWNDDRFNMFVDN